MFIASVKPAALLALAAIVMMTNFPRLASVITEQLLVMMVMMVVYGVLVLVGVALKVGSGGCPECSQPQNTISMPLQMID